MNTEPDPDGCPYCGAVGGVTRVACESPKVDAWSCTACQGQWWTSVVNPELRHLQHLRQRTMEVTARSILREVITLAEETPELSHGQLWVRAITLLIKLDQCARAWPG
ncbi:MAG: hypothetical protein JO272_14380 [Pseudonocardiales bacterium]|nr:hypothetical protein [Pseudonocardiales bacterium]